MISLGSLACTSEEACWLLSIMVLNALGSIGDGGDSQIIGSIENHGDSGGILVSKTDLT